MCYITGNVHRKNHHKVRNNFPPNDKKHEDAGLEASLIRLTPEMQKNTRTRLWSTGSTMKKIILILQDTALQDWQCVYKHWRHYYTQHQFSSKRKFNFSWYPWRNKEHLSRLPCQSMLLKLKRNKFFKELKNIKSFNSAERC